MSIRTACLLLAPVVGLMMGMAAHADPVALPDGTQVEDYEVGTGAEARTGQSVSVHYTGWLWLYPEEERGKNFDSSRSGDPLTFTLGAGNVIEGWDSGIVGMKEGGIRTLIIPPEAGYGAEGKGPVPPNSWMLFEVELIKVR
jgi:FKBP-type peptidyl-prolyl cis-trans isomerase